MYEVAILSLQNTSPMKPGVEIHYGWIYVHVLRLINRRYGLHTSKPPILGVAYPTSKLITPNAFPPPKHANALLPHHHNPLIRQAQATLLFRRIHSLALGRTRRAE